MTSASQTIGYLQAVGGRLVFVAGLLLGASVLAPAAEQAMTPEFLLQSWDVTHGLPSGKIQAVAQTPEGYWWIASSNGLIQFDGVRFVCYNTNNAPVLKDSWITCLLVTRAGELWAGTDGGYLTRRRNGVFEAVPLGLPGRKTKINALAEGPDGAVWIGTGASGVARWRQTGCDWFTVTDANNISCKDVTQIVADRQGRLWAVADEKLAPFENGVWKIASGIAASGQRRVMSVSPAQDGGLWVAACSLQTGLSGRGTQVFKLDHAGWAEPHPHYPRQSVRGYPR